MSFILRNHVDIAGLRELQYFGEYWDPRSPGSALRGVGNEEAVSAMFARQRRGILSAKPEEEDVEKARALLESPGQKDLDPGELFAATVHELATELGKTIPCEQTPRNIFYAESLLELFPNAHVIHMLRDPRAVMASQKQRWKRRKNATNKSGFPLSQTLRVWVNYHPFTVARLWRSASRIAKKLENKSRFTVVRFEDLLEAPEKTISGLCEQIGVDYDPGLLDVGQINSSHQSSVGGARRGLQKDAINKWQEELSRGEVSIAERICGEYMGAFGYASRDYADSGDTGELRYKLSYPLHLAGVFLVNPRRAWIQLRAVLNRAKFSRPRSAV